MKRLLLIFVFVLAAEFFPARAQSPDDQYVRIYSFIQQADALNEAGQSSQALGKYLEAQAVLQRLGKIYPDWNPKVVNFRLNYLEGKIAVLSAKAPAASKGATTGSQAASPAAAPTVSEADRKVTALENEVRQLEGEKTVLEAKLKEAFATQPAAIDARELAKAEEKIQSLMKENDLLKVAITRQQGEATPGAAQKGLEETSRALSETAAKLSEQTDRANALALEKETLQKRLEELKAATGNAAELGITKKELDAVNRLLLEQTERANKLAAEKDGLQSRLNSLAASAEAAEALRAENELLKKQVSDLKSNAPVISSSGSPDQLAQLQTRIASLQSDAEILRLEKAALQDRVKEAFSFRDENVKRIKQLERERDDLQKQLQASKKGGFFRRRGKSDAARIKELSDQVQSFRARLEVLEARAVPFSAEELALLQKPQAQLAVAVTKTSDGSPSQLPSGTTALASEAGRYFSAREFEKAEEKYREILGRDENNVYTLANLAVIELEAGHLEQAEEHLKRALAQAPNDARSLSLLGNLKFREQKYDEALDLLSRASQIDPQNTEILNYLGVTLSHKGMRGPAETALRKAIQIDPKYADAHNNLAVIYATQQPPLPGLARWHYQKALAAGHPRNDELEKMLDQKSSNAAPVAP